MPIGNLPLDPGALRVKDLTCGNCPIIIVDIQGRTHCALNLRTSILFVDHGQFREISLVDGSRISLAGRIIEGISNLDATPACIYIPIKAIIVNNSPVVPKELISQESIDVGGSAIEVISKVEEDSILSESIDTLSLTVRAANCLKAEKISTIGALLMYTENNLLKVENLGRKALNEILTALEGKNLKLADTMPV